MKDENKIIEDHGSHAFWLPKQQLGDWPLIGTEVIYIHAKGDVLPHKLRSGIVVGEQGEVKEHGTGIIHRPYGSNIFLAGSVIKPVSCKLT